MTDAIRTAIEGASAYLTEHPDEARYTDSVAIATVQDGLRVAVEGPGGERLETDMPAAVGGAGAAPGPGWVMRAAVAACVASLAAMRAAQLGITGLRCTVEVDSESDDRGILGLDAATPAGPLSMRISIALAADGDQAAQLEAVGAWAVDHCPVSDTVRRPIPVQVDVTVT
jgi:uncharacterized OsmC-like protein